LGLLFAAGFVGITVMSAVLAGAVPVRYSIAIVFLFAGPHNWLEARYILGRLPARVGKLWGFFLVSAAGIIGLTASFAALPLVVERIANPTLVGSLYAGWNTTFIFWVAALVRLRSRTNPRFDGGWVWPVALLITAGVWIDPIALNVLLVYLHPVLALVLLDRELGRSHRSWRPAYRSVVLVVPVGLAALWWQLHDAPDLPGTDTLTATIAAHAGAGFLEGVSTHFLVAAHTFLEGVHYAAWVVLIPLVGLRSWPWQLGTIPAARRGPDWAQGVRWVLVGGLIVVATLWVSFGLDYEMTRSVYFTIALLHVLAEIPFLLRMI
jgi:hypothetical protein